ncbi:hypothetical protein CBR_g45540 [Chara braunii]|uniref:non-specific serine/threonine protein kinase n=1 Tax=Chara braunii TaxID=69332 RepID=A0A388LYY9_CHABU|nr:hypothetical protein CBR_g45540 [Chara braunii]|eukprot:GBG87481.1 hypothetical protein CBR_g45540 [Chara braunii]
MLLASFDVLILHHQSVDLLLIGEFVAATEAGYHRRHEDLRRRSNNIVLSRHVSSSSISLRRRSQNIVLSGHVSSSSVSLQGRPSRSSTRTATVLDDNDRPQGNQHEYSIRSGGHACENRCSSEDRSTARMNTITNTPVSEGKTPNARSNIFHCPCRRSPANSRRTKQRRKQRREKGVTDFYHAEEEEEEEENREEEGDLKLLRNRGLRRKYEGWGLSSPIRSTWNMNLLYPRPRVIDFSNRASYSSSIDRLPVAMATTKSRPSTVYFFKEDSTGALNSSNTVVKTTPSLPSIDSRKSSFKFTTVAGPWEGADRVQGILVLNPYSLLVADNSMDLVRKVGVLYGTNSVGEFAGLERPLGLATHPKQQTLFVSGADRIWAIPLDPSLSSISSPEVLTGPHTYSLNTGLKDSANASEVRVDHAYINPRSISSDGIVLYVADLGNNCIRRVSTVTGATETVLTPQLGSLDGDWYHEPFSRPVSPVLTADGCNMFFGEDRRSGRVCWVTFTEPGGSVRQVTTILRLPGSNRIQCLTLSGDDRFLYVGTSVSVIFRYTINSSALHKCQQKGTSVPAITITPTTATTPLMPTTPTAPTAAAAWGAYYVPPRILDRYLAASETPTSGETAKTSPTNRAPVEAAETSPSTNQTVGTAAASPTTPSAPPSGRSTNTDMERAGAKPRSVDHPVPAADDSEAAKQNSSPAAKVPFYLGMGCLGGLLVGAIVLCAVGKKLSRTCTSEESYVKTKSRADEAQSPQTARTNMAEEKLSPLQSRWMSLPRGASSDATPNSAAEAEWQAGAHQEVLFLERALSASLFLSRTGAVSEKPCTVTTSHGVTSIGVRSEWTGESQASDGPVILESMPGLTRFTLSELSSATGDFGADHLLTGKGGGFGDVYRATMMVGQKPADVAIKVMKKGFGKANALRRKQFSAELQTLSELRHKHLCKLIGYCLEKNTCMLVYPFIPGGSLHDRLHDPAWPSLDLDERLLIAKQMATVLRYMHHEVDPPILHRDIKSHNVMVQGHGSKLSVILIDFGLAKLVSEDDDDLIGMSFHSSGSNLMQTVSTLTAAGTPGYMAPEYVIQRMLTTKNDVYAFGVVLLELITGRRAVIRSTHQPRQNTFLVTESRQFLLHDCNPMNYELLAGFFDPRLTSTFQSREEWEVVYFLAMFAMRCTNDAPQLRPTMQDAVNCICSQCKAVPV